MSLLKKLIIIFAVVVFFLFLALVGAAWYMGAFASVDLKTEMRGPYFIVSLPHIGPYQEISSKVGQVDAMLKEKGITAINAVGLYYDDPANVPPEQLRSHGGLIVSDSVQVDSPFVFQKIERRNVAIAAIEAHPAIAPFKTYPALREWMENKGYRMSGESPPLEIYYEQGLVEVEMAIITPESN